MRSSTAIETSVAIAALLASSTACSTRVSLGGDRGQGGDATTPLTNGGTGGTGNTGGMAPPPPCVELPCGEPCPIIEDCASDDCAGSSGFCDGFGRCVEQPPACAGDECSGMPCGAPCTICSGPGCEDRPNGGTFFCDGYGSCAPEVYCDPCQPSIFSTSLPQCGTPCDPCGVAFPEQPDCPPRPDLYVCDGHGQCVYTLRPECPAYDSCMDATSTCGTPCTQCAPNSATYPQCVRREMSGSPMVCDGNLTCVPIEPEVPECG